MAGLPGPDASRTPISAMKPSAIRSATRSEIVTRVSPVSRASLTIRETVDREVPRCLAIVSIFMSWR